MGDTESPAKEKKAALRVGGSARTARAWAVIACALFAVVGAAYCAYVAQRDRGVAELQALYAHALAHKARQIELKYDNYRQIVTSWTAMAGEAGRNSGVRRLSAAAYARNMAAKQAQKVAEARVERGGELGTERKAVEQALAAIQAASDSLVSATGEEATLRGKLQSAQADAKAALDASKAANDIAQTANERAASAAAVASAASDAADAADRAAAHAATASTEKAGPASLTAQSAAGEVSKAEDALNEAIKNATPGARPPAEAIPDAGLPSPPPNVDAANAAVRARRAAEQAKKVAIDEKKSADDARANVDAHARLAADALARAQATLEDLAKTEAAVRHSQSNGAAASTALSAALDHLKRAKDATDAAVRQRATAEGEAQKEENQIAQQEDRQSDGFPGLLSSYADDLDACKKPWPDLNDEVGLCLARRIAAANDGRERGLSIVRCPSHVSAGGTPAFASDGGPASVIFPPADKADAMAAACGRAEVGALGFTAEDPAKGARDARVFDQLLLMKTDGTTVYSASQLSNVRAISLPSVDPKRMVSSGFVRDLELGAGEYEAFFQPIDVSVAFPCPPGSACPPSSAQAEGLVLCGLVPKDRYLGSMNHVSPTEFLLGAAVLGMSVLLLPLAKLWLVGRRSRFRRFDVALLVTSALVATFLLTMLMLSHLAKNRLYHRLDKQLAAVSAKATTRLTKQIAKGANVLRQFTESTRDLRYALGAFADASGEPDRAALSRSCSGGISGGGGRGEAESSPPVCEVTHASIAPSADEGWTLASWANANGDQQIKYVPPPRAHAPNPLNVAHRAYFQRAMANEIGCFVSDLSDCRSDDLRGTAEVVRSSATGSIVLILARPTFTETLHSPPDPKSKPNGVATVDRILEPFEKPVLPIGFQMAVVDSEGRVMLHSNGEEQQGQNLFDDLDDPGPLRALMSARASDWLDATYLGVESRFHVMHVPGIGWTVITIARRDLVEAPTANMVVLTTAGFVALGALVVFMGVLALTLWRLLGIPGVRQPTVTLRPSSLERRRYLRAAWWMILGTASVGAFAIGSTPAVPMTGVLLLALFVAVAGVVMLRTRALDRCVGLRTPNAVAPEPAARRAPIDFAASYTLCCFGIAGVLVVGPVTALFVGAFDHLADNLVRSEEAHFAAQVHDDIACFENGESNEGACSPVFQGEPPIQVHKEAAIERYFASCWAWPLACVEDALPPILTGGIDVFARLYLSPRSSDPSPPSGRTWIRTTTDQNLIPLGSSKRMTSPLPRLSNVTGYDLKNLAVVVSAFALLLVPALLVSYLSIRRVLFLDLSASLTRPGPEPSTWLGSNRKLLLLYPPIATEAMLSGLGYTDVTAFGPSSELPDEAVFAVAESIPRGYRTDLFERLARKAGAVVLLARTDPVSRAPCDVRDDVASALKTFEVVRGSLAKPFVPRGQAGTALFACLWSESTEDEQRVLAQIAIDGHSSPHFANRSTLESLCGRGLLEAATLSFASADFAAFVRESATAERLDAWESSDGDTAWQMMRIPLATGITALSVILSSSHLEFAATGVLVPTIAAVLPTVAKLLTGSTSSG